jgi:hypothetical protein
MRVNHLPDSGSLAKDFWTETPLTQHNSDMRRALVDRALRFLIFTSQSHWPYYLILCVGLSYSRLLNGPVIGGLIGMMLVDSFFAWERQFKCVQELTKESNGSEEKRVFVRSHEAVLALYGRNGYDVLARANPFFGKWVRISGTFEGAMDALHDETIHVSLRLGNGRPINLQFAAESGGEISGLATGQTITAISRIEPVPNYGGGYFVFTESKIVSVKPLDSRRNYVLQSVS